VLVNNAAIEPQTRFHVLTPAEIEQVLQVDLISPLLLSRLVLPGMLERGYGRIINVSSLAGHTSFPYTQAYAAAKDGLTAFSRVLTSDWREPAGGGRRRPGRRVTVNHVVVATTWSGARRCDNDVVGRIPGGGSGGDREAGGAGVH
jgi:NAD(P)-dependent dehydrogenase (short-subunit alcohol dehydrogenase family)